MKKSKEEICTQAPEQDLETLLSQVEELSAQVRRNSEDREMQRVLYRIADVTSASEDMDSFYTELHNIVGELTSARAFYIAIYHEKEQCVSFPYYVDEYDDAQNSEDLPLHNKSLIPVKELEESWTLRVIRENEMVRLRQGNLGGIGKCAEDWVGLPLRINGQPIGVLTIQSYEPGFRYSDRDIELVTFVSQHIATALQRRQDADAINEAHSELKSSAIELENANEQLKQQIQDNQKIHQRMVELSHQAGKAEIATGVLHNVGNVLNSVNVSVGLIQETFQVSKLTSLQRAAALIDGQDDLADFLVNDKRGMAFPGYLVKLAGQLNDDQAAVRCELKSLHEHLEHIKAVVAMQQSYAGISGLKETVAMPDLLMDAELLVASSFEKHFVDVKRDYDDFPFVAIEKQKVLQILVNLLKNAKDALIAHRTENRQLTVRIKHLGSDRLTIAISDNGVGVSPEELTKIFSHGFTTKRNGHGYGLHSCANAANEMGGKLYVTSDGRGKGATFTLELPYEPMEQPHVAPVDSF